MKETLMKELREILGGDCEELAYKASGRGWTVKTHWGEWVSFWPSSPGRGKRVWEIIDELMARR